MSVNPEASSPHALAAAVAVAPVEQVQPPIADVVRDAIRQRLLPPGMPLVQGALADALGVSRVPVREALQYLASEGLVTFTDDGVRVTVLPPAEIQELWSLRALVEPAMAGAIAERVSPAELEGLRALVAAMDDAVDGDAWSDLNYAFHRELYRIARMPHHAAMAMRILTQIEPYSRVAVNNLAGRPAAQAEHHEMIAALDRRDAEALREVLERHSLRAGALLAGYAAGAAPAGAVPDATSEAAKQFAARLFSSPTQQAGSSASGSPEPA